MSHENEHDRLSPDALSRDRASAASACAAPAQVDRDRLMFLAGQASVLSAGRPGSGNSRVTRRLSGDSRIGSGPRRRRRWRRLRWRCLWHLPSRPTPQPQIVYRDRRSSALPRTSASNRTSRLRAGGEPNTVPITLAVRSGNMRSAFQPTTTSARARSPCGWGSMRSARRRFGAVAAAPRPLAMATGCSRLAGRSRTANRAPGRATVSQHVTAWRQRNAISHRDFDC